MSIVTGNRFVKLIDVVCILGDHFFQIMQEQKAPRFLYLRNLKWLYRRI